MSEIDLRWQSDNDDDGNDDGGGCTLTICTHVIRPNEIGYGSFLSYPIGFLFGYKYFNIEFAFNFSSTTHTKLDCTHMHKHFAQTCPKYFSLNWILMNGCSSRLYRLNLDSLFSISFICIIIIVPMSQVNLLLNYFTLVQLKYRSNNILITFGDDFHYQAADHWFNNLDKLILWVHNFAIAHFNNVCGVKTIYCWKTKWECHMCIYYNWISIRIANKIWSPGAKCFNKLKISNSYMKFRDTFCS